ncbi:MAG: hypothetical protein LBS43_07390 [Prevotellaceae bacterium]|nr:hypothetical protein [Prevotellaceae bacterium]
MKRYNRSQIFKAAWTAYKGGKAVSFGVCLKNAWADAILSNMDFTMFEIPVSKPDANAHKFDTTTKAGITRFRITEKLLAGYTQAQV